MIVCIPVSPDGSVNPRWGRAARLAVARAEGGQVLAWDEHDVGWDALHDAGPEDAHHARIARFVEDHRVEVVLAGHMGGHMVEMLAGMGIDVRLGVAGDARHAVEAATQA